MKKPVKIAAALSLVIALTLSACDTPALQAQNQGQQAQNHEPQAQGPQRILPNQPEDLSAVKTEYGRLVDVRVVPVQSLSTGGGMAVGAAAGAGIGNAVMMGGARGGGALIGMVAGALAGGTVEHQLEKRKALRYTVAKADGRTATIIQGITKNEPPLKTGQRVVIKRSGGQIRVLPVVAAKD